jgi:hypothetical protein
MLGRLQAWNGTYGKAAAAMSREWLDFLNRRLREDAALPQRLASCRAPDEAWHICSEFWQRALQDYQEEFIEFARLNGEAVSEGFDVLQGGRNGRREGVREAKH